MVKMWHMTGMHQLKGGQMIIDGDASTLSPPILIPLCLVQAGYVPLGVHDMKFNLVRS